MKILNKFKFKFWLWKNGFNSPTLNLIVNEYIKSLPTTKDLAVDEKPICIGLIGGVASGKTTVAKEISQRIPVTVINADDGRRLLSKMGYPDQVIKQRLIYYIGLLVIKEFIKIKRCNLIIDGDLIIPEGREAILRPIKNSGYRIFLCNIITDEKMAFQRMEDRLKYEKSEYMKRAIHTAFEQQKKYREEYSLPEIFFTFNNNGSPAELGSQIDEMIGKI